LWVISSIETGSRRAIASRIRATTLLSVPSPWRNWQFLPITCSLVCPVVRQNWSFTKMSGASSRLRSEIVMQTGLASTATRNKAANASAALDASDEMTGSLFMVGRSSR
jgi:hypothetical protein